MQTHFRVLEASMRSSKRSFDGLRYCLNFAYTGGALGATRMLFSRELVCDMSQEATIRRTRKGDFLQDSSHVSGRQYTFGCIIDKKRGTLCPHIRDLRVPDL